VLRLIAARSAALARYETLGRDAGIDGKTAKSHVDVLERLFLVRVRRPWHANLGRRQVKAPKAYVADTGLLAGLMGIDEQRIRNDDGVAGAWFETFVATELERQASWSVAPLTFWHYREQEREVDIIVERPSGELVGIEVKACDRPGTRLPGTQAHARSARVTTTRRHRRLHRSTHAAVR
jgi:predicted AAA+ superfamily ATPase